MTRHNNWLTPARKVVYFFGAPAVLFAVIVIGVRIFG